MSSEILAIRNLSKTYERSGRWSLRSPEFRVVDNVSFTLGRGQTFGLVGESGSGKTTIARLLLRLIEADDGVILFDGVDVRTMSNSTLRQMRRRLQIVTQNPSASFDPRIRVGQAIAQPIRLHRLRRETAIPDRVDELLYQVGLPPDLRKRFPHELSLGQLQRLAISRALAVEPELIVLDEVVSALDVVVKAQVLELLMNLQKRLHLSFVFISHDAKVIRRMADEVGVLFAGRMVERGPTSVLFSHPHHPYTHALLSSSSDKTWPGTVSPYYSGFASLESADPGCQFAPRCPLVMPKCREERPGLAEIGSGSHVAACVRTPEQTMPVRPMALRTKFSDARKLRQDLLAKAAGGVELSSFNAPNGRMPSGNDC